MTFTKIKLDKQTESKIYDFGDDLSNGESLITFHKGLQLYSYYTNINKGSSKIDGNVLVGGNITIKQTNNNINNEAINIVDSNDTIIGQIKYDPTKASKFTIGDGTNQQEITTSETSLTQAQIIPLCIIFGG